MSDLQNEPRDLHYSDTHLEADISASTQELVLGAYLDEKKKWEDKLKLTSDLLAYKAQQQVELENSIHTQSKFKIFINNLFKRKSKQEKILTIVLKEIDQLKNQFVVVSSSPPRQNAYELAIMGNRIFSCR
jgi:hypothetical protein